MTPNNQSFDSRIDALIQVKRSLKKCGPSEALRFRAELLVSLLRGEEGAWQGEPR